MAGAVPRPPLGTTRPLVVHGRVRGLYPGASRRMRLVVRNPSSTSVRLTRVTARVANASARCHARNVTIEGFAGSRAIPARGSVRILLPTRMRTTAPNACQGARFPLTFTATMAGA